jgi:hypothetical protein
MLPPSASSKRPSLRLSAPVKAPRSWPNSSLSTSPAEIAPQLTLTKGRSRRLLWLWMARATSSLPVPVSPKISTVLSVAATCSTRPSSRRSAGVCPTISSNPR